jgi:protein TonB
MKKITLLLFAVFISSLSFAQTEDTLTTTQEFHWFTDDYPIEGDWIIEDDDKDPPLRFVDEMPEPVSGFDTMFQFIHNNLNYLVDTTNKGISGVVFIEFVVEKDGTISNVKLLAGVRPDLDNEALRVVKMLPKWKPGKCHGKPARCYFKIPVNVTIK